tara:strand:- start:132 stop:377 length:246 start_codon:yes stop_codon:yes gene_type:complete
MIEERVTIQMVGALKARLEADRAGALAELMVFLRNPTGTGDHSSILDTCDELLSRVSDADGKLALLERTFQITNEPSPEEQ